MSITVCPAAIIAAPIEMVWQLLDNPAQFDEWADGTIQWIKPEGPTAPSQQFCIKSRALGRSWSALFTVKEVNQDKHVLQMDVVFPLGMQLHQRLMCASIDATSCRVQYG